MKNLLILIITLSIATMLSAQQESLDMSFAHGKAPIPLKTLLLKNQKIVFIGEFDKYITIPANRIIVLNSNGTKDNSFDYGSGFDSLPLAVCENADGKIYIVGRFTNYNGNAINGIVRLNMDGSIDNSFNPGSGFGWNPVAQNNTPTTCACTQDGRLIVAGNFSSYDNTPANRIVSINSDGSHTTNFNTGSGIDTNGFVPHFNAIRVDKDNKIWLVGYFNNYNNQVVKNIVRLNPNGTLDTSFNQPTAIRKFFFPSFKDIAFLKNGKILLSGEFDTINGYERSHIARFENNGTLDLSFTPPKNHGVFNRINAMAIQPDNKIIVAGRFTEMDSISKLSMARLLPNGELDIDFMSTENGVTGTSIFEVGNIFITHDGNILASGGISSFKNQQVSGIIKLKSDIFPVSSNELEAHKANIKAYPNPAIHSIIINTNQSGFSIYNSQGQLMQNVIQNPLGEHEINISQYPVGLYIVRTENGETLKFIKSE